MTTLRLLLITCTASMLSMCTNVAAADRDEIQGQVTEQALEIEQASPVDETCSELDYKLYQQRLQTVAHDFASLSTIVAPTYLDKAQKHNYLRFLQACQAKYKQLTKNSKCLDHRLFVAEQFVESMKKAYLKLELLTMGLADSTQALVALPLNQRGHHHALATAYLELAPWLESNWIPDQLQIIPLSNHQITAIICHIIAIDGSGSFLSQLFAFAKKDHPAIRLNSVLLVDLYENYSTLVDNYLSCMKLYQSCKYAYDVKKHAQLVATLEMLMASCEEKKQTEFYDEKIVLNFFIAKLFCIKQEIEFAQQLDRVNKLYPDHINLFMKHNRLICSGEFAGAYAKLAYEAQEHLDRYVTLMEHFFAAHTTLPLLFVNDLEATIAGVKKLKPSKNWPQAMVDKFTNKMDLFIGMMDKFAGAIDKLPGTDERTHLFDEILEVLESTYEIITKKPEASSTWSDIVQYVRSGAWFSSSAIKKVSQDDSGTVALEFAEGLLPDKKFGDAKSAALHVLACASPFLLAKIIQHLKPRLSKELDTQLEALIDPKPQKPTKNYDKIIDFANSNPEILQQLNAQHPEILDLLALSLKELAQKS